MCICRWYIINVPQITLYIYYGPKRVIFQRHFTIRLNQANVSWPKTHADLDTKYIFSYTLCKGIDWKIITLFVSLLLLASYLRYICDLPRSCVTVLFPWGEKVICLRKISYRISHSKKQHFRDVKLCWATFLNSILHWTGGITDFVLQNRADKISPWMIA